MAVHPAIQPNVSWTPTRKKFTVDEYYRLGDIGVIAPDERTELIEGEIYKMSPIGCYHAACVGKISKIFYSLFLTCGSIRIQQPIRINDYSEPEPDVSIVHLKDNEYADGHPRPDEVYLVVEVSVTSLDFEQSMKLELYAKANIPEVWTVDIENDAVEKYTAPADGHYQSNVVLKKTDTLHVEAFEDKKFEVNDILPAKSNNDKQ